MKARGLFVVLATLHCLTNAQAQQEIADFTLTNAVDGKAVSLSDYTGNKAVTVVFTSNDCAYSIYYENRIKTIAQEYRSKGVAFLLVNAHTTSDESVEKMAQKAREVGYTMPYLADKDQKVMKLFGAKKSPEVFLLSVRRGKFVLYYRGAIDNNPQVENDVKLSYLRESINNLLANKNNPYGQQRPTGCVIR